MATSAARLLLVGSVLVCLPSGGAAAEGDSLPALLEGYRTLSPAETGFSVQDRSVEVGHLEIQLWSGALYPLRSRDGGVLGLFFEGRGRYRYVTEEPSDRQVIAANLARCKSQLKIHDFSVSDRFSRFVLFFTSPLFEELWQGGTSAPLEAETRANFEKMWKRIALTYLEYDHLAAEAQLNAGGGRYLYVEFEGDTETVGYSLDSVRHLRERLFSFIKYAGWDVRHQRLLSLQNVPPPTGHGAGLHLKHAKIDVATDDNRRGTITSELTFEVTREGLRVVPLSLVNNRDPHHYDWASATNRLEVKKILDEQGNPLQFSHRYYELLVRLPEGLARGSLVRLRFETAGDILTGMGGERHDNYFELFTADWFPRPAFFQSTPFTFELRIRTRKPYAPVASGTTVAFRDLGDHFELESRSTVPVFHLAVLAGKYKTREIKFENLTIRIHAYAMASKFIMETLPGLTQELIRFYRDHLGPFPFEELDVVEVPEYGFGISPAGMVLLTTEAYKPRHDWLAGYLARGAPSILAHEVAHQWFGNENCPESPEENWLSESFAEYLSGMAMLAGQTDDRRVVGFKRMFAEWQASTKECADVGPIRAANMLGGEGSGFERHCLLYNRGPLVLHMFRTMVGEERFYAILRRFLEQTSFRQVTTEDLKKATREVLRTDFDWFFDQWFREGGIPEIRVEHRVEPAGGGKFVLSGRVEQPDGPAFKKMVIPLVLDYGASRREAKVFLQERPVQEFRYEIPEKPSRVTVDPAQNNLAVYR